MVVHVLGSMGAGGNERLCLGLLQHAPPGTRQALITIDPSPDGALAGVFATIPGLQFFHLPYSPRGRVMFVARLGRLLLKLRPRGVVAYSFGLHLLVALAAKAVPGCRCIVHAGNPPATTGQHRRDFLFSVRGSRWLGTPMWCCSQTTYDQFSALGIGLPAGSRAQPNGIDIDQVRAGAAKGRQRRNATGPIIGMVARLDAIKDHATLIAAFARVVRERPTAELWLVGDGERRETLQRQVNEAAIESSVSFMGVRNDVAELLGRMDLFAFSTTPAEGFGIALAEAMAVGLPIVASDVPACREVLDAGACGRLVPPRDAESLAAAMLRLLDDGPDAARLGTAATARARRRYDIAGCAAEYYGYLLEGR